MIFILIVFFLSLLISNSRFRQAKYLFFLSSLLHLLLYFNSSEYSVDYGNYLRIWENTPVFGNMTIFVEDFMFYQLISILKSFKFTYISLPIFSLLLSLYSTYTLSKTFRESTSLIFSSLILPLTTYLSFHNIRQSISISFFIIAISLLLSNNSDSFKKFKIIIFSFFALFTHFTLIIYFLTFLIFYFFSDYLLDLKTNIVRINLKINKRNFTLFSISIVVFIILLFLSRNIVNDYLLKFLWYSSLTSDIKYYASSAILFAIFTFFLSLFTILNFFQSSFLRKLPRSQKAIILLNLFSFIQLPLCYVASTVSMRISFYSLLISVISIAIFKKYAYLKNLQLRSYTYYINIFYLGLLCFAETLTVYRSLLPF